MARFHGYVGYAVDIETAPGVWDEEITEHEYYGDVLKNRANIQQSSDVNPGISISHSISIVGDPFAYEYLYAMRYVVYLGRKWTIKSVEVERPRIILSLGGLENG